MIYVDLWNLYLNLQCICNIVATDDGGKKENQLVDAEELI